MNIKHKIIIGICVLFIVVAGTWIARTQYQHITDQVYKNTQDEVVKYVSDRAPTLSTPEDFATDNRQQQARVFENLFVRIRTNELFRIKVFNTNYVIIWTNLTENIGIRNQTSTLLRDAMAGNPGIEIKAVAGAEHVGEDTHVNFLEVFVPIKNTDGEIVGVIEAYQDIEKDKDEINSQFLTWLLGIIALVCILSFAVILAVRKIATKNTTS